ncbi:hypothetical protein, partial [Paenibacillus sacheonensis]|uniref:hypothetical protein n=1 Tax=Paenibacillus sacheonensis TaxID=742054 RepID=UPI001BAA9D2A
CVWANHHFLLLLNHLVTRTLSCCFNYKEKKEQAPQKWRAYSFFHFFSGLLTLVAFLDHACLPYGEPVGYDLQSFNAYGLSLSIS